MLWFLALIAASMAAGGIVGGILFIWLTGRAEDRAVEALKGAPDFGGGGEHE